MRRSITAVNYGGQLRRRSNPTRAVERLSAFFQSFSRSSVYVVPLLLLSQLVVPALAQNTPRKAAIFVANHAEKAFDEKLPTFADFITGRFTDKGFSVLSREVSTDALSSLLKDSKQTDADQLLSNNSTVLRLGQMLGADYLIVASITSFGSDKRSVDAYGVKTVNITHNLRVTYKILDGVHGGTLAGDTLKASKTARFTENYREELGDLINGLLEDASLQIAESLGKKEIKTASAQTGAVEFSISCGMQDLAQLPVSIPDVRLTKDNTVVVEKDRLEVQPLDVTVELDGVVAGSAPGTFKAMPGLHKIRLSREGFTPWERTINVVEGQKLKVALQMSDAGYQRWKDNTAFLQSLENAKTLTDAQAERIKGDAQRLRQSGYKVDVKVDTKEGFVTQQNQSIFSQLPGALPVTPPPSR
ncbi:MAG: PEGA domain-containing protein [Verrucomicrobia bacterium]|nr:PEGA domain-containing protein [Verrucomicrobiota bacterium]